MKNYGWSVFCYLRRSFSVGFVAHGWYVSFCRARDTGKLHFTIMPNIWRKTKTSIPRRGE